MGLLSLFKSSESNTSTSGLPRDLIDFLKRVDTLYMAAFSLKSTKDIARYLTPDFRHKLTGIICSINTRYFGDEKYRKTTWSLVSDNNGVVVVSKDVKFDNVRVAGRLSIQVASNYKEIWTVVCKDNNYLLDSIRAA